MFKVPVWEDTPGTNLSFKNVSPKKNKQKSKTIKTSEKLQPVVPGKPKFKAKTKSNSNLKLANRVNKINKTENTQKRKKSNLKIQQNSSKVLVVNKKDSDDDSNITNYDSDKLDELILDVKKQRLDTFKNDDNEEILFKETPENVLRHTRNRTGPNKFNNKIKTDSSTTEPDTNKEISNQESPTKNKVTTNKPFNNIKNKASISEKPGKPKQVLSSSSLPREFNKEQIAIRDKITTTKNAHTDYISVVKESVGNVKLKKLRKKELLKSILEKYNYRNHINVHSNKLRERMLDRMKAAQFRYLNEKLYTSSGSDAQKLFEGDPHAFQTYHMGYQQQVKKWPIKPLDVIVKRIKTMPKTHKIADMGCGEADLSKRVAQTVRSFDLVASTPGVEVCDMAHTPLLAQSMDVAVYCLALMGTDLTQYLIEANRVLKLGGHLLIAEVESRFDDVSTFTSDVQRLGFSLKKMDDSHQVFYFLEFTKLREPPVKKAKLPTLTLKPCIYKRR